MTIAERARRGERSRTPRRIGSSTSTCVSHDNATTAVSRTANRVSPSRCVRAGVSTRYVGQCQRYISYEMPPTHRSGVDSNARPKSPDDGCVSRQSTIAVATEYASSPSCP